MSSFNIYWGACRRASKLRARLRACCLCGQCRSRLIEALPAITITACRLRLGAHSLAKHGLRNANAGPCLLCLPVRGVQALEGQRDGLEHLMQIVKKDKQDLEVSWLCPKGPPLLFSFVPYIGVRDYCRNRLFPKFSKCRKRKIFREGQSSLFSLTL